MLIVAEDSLDVGQLNGRVDVESEVATEWSGASHVGALLTVLAAARNREF